MPQQTKNRVNDLLQSACCPGSIVDFCNFDVIFGWIPDAISSLSFRLLAPFVYGNFANEVDSEVWLTCARVLRYFSLTDASTLSHCNAKCAIISEGLPLALDSPQNLQILDEWPFFLVSSVKESHTLFFFLPGFFFSNTD